MTRTSARLSVAFAAAALASSAGAGSAEPASCRLRPGMYEERARLEREYGRAWERSGRTTGPEAERLLEARRSIDREYLAFFHAAAAHGKEDGASPPTCCEAAKPDPVAALFCALLSYTAGDRTDPAPFTAAIPVGGRRLHALWKLDEIAAVGGELPAIARVSPAGEGLVGRFIAELYDLAAAGDARAADRFLALYSTADGAFAEEMQDRLIALFDERPQVVVRLWPTFRRYRGRLRSLSDVMSADQARAISERFDGHCKADDRACREIRELLR